MFGEIDEVVMVAKGRWKAGFTILDKTFTEVCIAYVTVFISKTAAERQRRRDYGQA